MTNMEKLHDEVMEMFGGGKLRPGYEHRMDQLINLIKGSHKSADGGWEIIEKEWRKAQKTGMKMLITNAFTDDYSEEDLEVCKMYYFEHY